MNETITVTREQLQDAMQMASSWSLSYADWVDGIFARVQGDRTEPDYEPPLNEYDPFADWPIEDEYTIPGTFLCLWRCPDCQQVCQSYFIAPSDTHMLEHNPCGVVH